MLVVTSENIPGYKITEVKGLVQGASIKSRTVFGNMFGNLKTMFENHSAFHPVYDVRLYLAERDVQANRLKLFYFFFSILYFLLNFSILPALSTNFCLPV